MLNASPYSVANQGSGSSTRQLRARAAKAVDAEQQRRHQRPAREVLHVQVLGVVAAELRPERARLDLEIRGQAGRHQVRPPRPRALRGWGWSGRSRPPGTDRWPTGRRSRSPARRSLRSCRTDRRRRSAGRARRSLPAWQAVVTERGVEDERQRRVEQARPGRAHVPASPRPPPRRCSRAAATREGAARRAVTAAAFERSRVGARRWRWGRRRCRRRVRGAAARRRRRRRIGRAWVSRSVVAGTTDNRTGTKTWSSPRTARVRRLSATRAR